MSSDHPSAPAAPGQVVADQPGGNVALDLFVLTQHLGTLLSQTFRDGSLSPTQYAVYSQLAAGALTPGELGERLGMRPTTLSGHLAELERRGHLTRERSTADGRSVLVSLTAAGQDTRRAGQRAMRRAVEALHSRLGDETSVAEVRAQLAHLDHAVRGATADL